MAGLGNFKVELAGTDRLRFDQFTAALQMFGEELKRYNDNHEREIITVDLGEGASYTGPRLLMEQGWPFDLGETESHEENDKVES